MKNVFLLFLLLSTFSLSAATITWTGDGDSQSWLDGNNWDIGQVPGSNDIAIIPDGVDAVVIDDGLFVEVLRLEIGEKSIVFVDKNMLLQTRNSVGHGILIKKQGLLWSKGIIQVIQTTSNGINNEGVLRNEGELFIESITNRGLLIESAGVLENEAGAIIKIFETGSTGLRCNGKMRNAGRIEFLKGQWRPFEVSGIVENYPSGELIIEDQYPYPTSITGHFENHGEWRIMGSSTFGQCLQLGGSGYLLNERRGDIILTLPPVIGAKGMTVYQNGYLRNSGLIRVNSAGLNHSQRGISMEDNARMINRQSASVELNDFHLGLWLSSTIADWKNYGDYDINDNRTAIHANADGYNSGTINAEGRWNIQQNTEWTNGGGDITITTGSTTGIFVVGSLTNERCGRIRVDGQLRVLSNGELINDAFLELGEGGNTALIYGSLINNGTIHDPGEKLSNNFTNNSLRITPLDEPYSPPCDYYYANVFELGGAVSVELPLDFFTTPDLDLSDYGGFYFEYDNEAYLVDHYPVYYAEFTDSQYGCSQVYGIPWESCTFISNDAPRVELTTTPLDTKAESKPGLSPNPTNGQLQIQAPTSYSGQVTIRLVDALGRLLWENEIPSEVTSTIDLPSSLSNGWYVVHFFDADQLLHSEKVLLHKD